MEMGLQDEVALVAASSKGLGRAIAYGLAKEGAKVAICARGEEALARTATEIEEATGAPVLAMVADLTKKQNIENLVARVVEEFGRLDILVTNAGGPPPGLFVDLTDEKWEEAFQLTLMSAVRLCREVIPHMRRQGGGRIITMTSISVKQPLENLMLSNSLRLAVIGLTKTLANELAKDNIIGDKVRLRGRSNPFSPPPAAIVETMGYWGADKAALVRLENGRVVFAYAEDLIIDEEKQCD